MKEVLLQFDGGSRGNPGISGAGAVIYVDNEEKISACIPVFEQITNNQAEYLGLKEGLKIAVEEGFKIIKIQGDSLLVINQVKGTWKVKNKNLKIIKDEICEIINKNSLKVTLEHIYRTENKRADELANEAMDIVSNNLKNCV